MENVAKTFGRNRALRGVSLTVKPGEIHGLVGQNGCGKSTLAKVLTGYHAPDGGGRVLVDGHELRLPVRPLEARQHGVAVVHQSLGLVDDQTVLDNLRVGRFRPNRLSRRIRWDQERDQARAVLDRLGSTVALTSRVGTLAEQDRATVAIARALQDAEPGRGLIIFDESTRSLSRRALEHFYDLIDDVVGTGTAVLLISHRLEEVIGAADRVTVLRDGSVVESGVSTRDLSEAELAALVVGRDLLSVHRDVPALDARQRPAVEINGVCGATARDVTMSIAAGEVLGVTGLDASGYDEVPYLLAGARPAGAGSIRIDDTVIQLRGLDCAGAIAAGVALVPESRERAGVALEATVADNISLPATSRRPHSLLRVDRAAERAVVADWVARLDVRPPVTTMAVGKLSGGNQQKVLLAKWLATAPKLLVLHEPTQAVDVGARSTIFDAIRHAAVAGCAVLVAGSDENELALLCDRVLVFRDGKIAEELVDDISPDAIVAATFASTARRALRPSVRRGA